MVHSRGGWDKTTRTIARRNRIAPTDLPDGAAMSSAALQCLHFRHSYVY